MHAYIYIIIYMMMNTTAAVGRPKRTHRLSMTERLPLVITWEVYAGSSLPNWFELLLLSIHDSPNLLPLLPPQAHTHHRLVRTVNNSWPPCKYLSSQSTWAVGSLFSKCSSLFYDSNISFLGNGRLGHHLKKKEVPLWLLRN